MTTRAVAALFAAGVTLAAASPVAGQRFSVAAKLGTTGAGADVVASLAPKLALKAGMGFSLVDFDLDIGGQSYRVEPPPLLLTGALDIRLAGPVRIMAGLLHRTDDIRFAGDLEGSVEIGDRVFDAPGRLEGALTSAATSPFVGVGFGGLRDAGFHLYLDLALAFTGDPGVALEGSGPITQAPDFEAELEKERLQILDDTEDYTRYWPIVNLGFRIGF